MKRRFLSVALIGAMLATSVPAFAADDSTDSTTLPFTDVAAGSWYVDAVTYAYGEGLMTGTSATEFAPDLTMTRAMIASVLYRLEGSPDLSDEDLGYPYEDVQGDAWYAMPVYWARANGVMAGYSDETFGPNDTITREQLAATLYKYTAFKGQDVSARADLSGYSDAGTISAWAKDVLSWANAEGYVNGMTDTTIDPLVGATRAQVAAIFERYLQDDTTPVDPEGQTVQLMIGRDGAEKQVQATVSEVTPEAIIAAIAKETGWNLDLAKPVSIGASEADYFQKVATVAFAADSGIYGQPPEPQKDAYHVYDVEDWIVTIFNSVDASLRANGYDGTCLTAPDGGKLTIDNGDVHFYLMPNFVWYEDTATSTNHQDPDLLNLAVFTPSGEEVWPTGLDVITLNLPVADVTFEGGTFTIYDEAGNVVQASNLTDNAWVDHATSDAYRDYFAAYWNFDETTVVQLSLDQPLAPGNYSVHVDGQSILTDDGRYLKEVSPERWTFSLAGFGISENEMTEGTTLPLGTTYAVEIMLDGEHADRAVISCPDGYMESDVQTLTESGTIHLTAAKATGGKDAIVWRVEFYKGDTPVTVINNTVTIA